MPNKSKAQLAKKSNKRRHRPHSTSPPKRRSIVGQDALALFRRNMPPQFAKLAENMGRISLGIGLPAFGELRVAGGVSSRPLNPDQVPVGQSLYKRRRRHSDEVSRLPEDRRRSSSSSSFSSSESDSSASQADCGRARPRQKRGVMQAKRRIEDNQHQSHHRQAHAGKMLAIEYGANNATDELTKKANELKIVAESLLKAAKEDEAQQQQHKVGEHSKAAQTKRVERSKNAKRGKQATEFDSSDDSSMESDSTASGAADVGPKKKHTQAKGGNQPEAPRRKAGHGAANALSSERGGMSIVDNIKRAFENTRAHKAQKEQQQKARAEKADAGDFEDSEMGAKAAAGGGNSDSDGEGAGKPRQIVIPPEIVRSRMTLVFNNKVFLQGDGRTMPFDAPVMHARIVATRFALANDQQKEEMLEKFANGLIRGKLQHKSQAELRELFPQLINEYVASLARALTDPKAKKKVLKEKASKLNASRNLAVNPTPQATDESIAMADWNRKRASTSSNAERRFSGAVPPRNSGLPGFRNRPILLSQMPAFLFEAKLPWVKPGANPPPPYSLSFKQRLVRANLAEIERLRILQQPDPRNEDGNHGKDTLRAFLADVESSVIAAKAAKAAKPLQFLGLLKQALPPILNRPIPTPIEAAAAPNPPPTNLTSTSSVPAAAGKSLLQKSSTASASKGERRVRFIL